MIWVAADLYFLAVGVGVIVLVIVLALTKGQ